jgi:hypothetical protein
MVGQRAGCVSADCSVVWWACCAVSVVLLGAVATTARAHEAAAAGEVAKKAFAGGVVFNFVYLLVTSLLLGAASGLGIAVALRRLTLKDAHQVRLL